MPPFADRKFKRKDRAGPGRPPVAIDEYFAKIEPFLRLGMTLSSASICGQIPRRTVYDYYNTDVVFRTKCDAARFVPKVLARSTVLKSIKDGNAALALEYLRNTEPEEFGTKSYLEQETHHVIDYDAEFEQRVKKYDDPSTIDIPIVGNGPEALPAAGEKGELHPADAPVQIDAAGIR